MPQYQVYIKTNFLFDMTIDAASWNDAAFLALKRFQAKGGIRDRMVKAFAPGEFSFLNFCLCAGTMKANPLISTHSRQMKTPLKITAN